MQRRVEGGIATLPTFEGSNCGKNTGSVHVTIISRDCNGHNGNGTQASLREAISP